jgi:hypothetical protein
MGIGTQRRSFCAAIEWAQGAVTLESVWHVSAPSGGDEDGVTFTIRAYRALSHPGGGAFCVRYDLTTVPAWFAVSLVEGAIPVETLKEWKDTGRLSPAS